MAYEPYGSNDLAVGYAMGRDSNSGNANGMWGADSAWWIIILLIFGWGGNGFGGFGNGGGYMNGALTRGELCQDMNFNDLQSAVRGVSQGICDSTFALNNTMTNGFAGVQQTLCQGFSGVNTGLMQQGYETRNAISDLGYRLQDCCCQTQRAIEGVNYNMAKNTCDITNAINGSTQQILGFLTQEKISALQSENAALTAQLSQNAQTQTLINTLRPCPVPSYQVCSPFESVYGAGRQGNCGCGC